MFNCKVVELIHVDLQLNIKPQ